MGELWVGVISCQGGGGGGQGKNHPELQPSSLSHVPALEKGVCHNGLGGVFSPPTHLSLFLHSFIHSFMWTYDLPLEKRPTQSKAKLKTPARRTVDA